MNFVNFILFILGEAVRHKKILPAFTIISSIIPGIINAQEINTSVAKELLSAQISRLNNIHDSVFVLHDNLVNGRLYISTADIYNHPFFLENSWKPGTVYYSGTFSGSEIMKYDLLTDNLIILLKLQGISYPVSINREIVREFILNGHHFILLDDFQNRGTSEPVTGYYETLYNGTTGLFVRWMKREAANKLTMQNEYPQEVIYYLRKDGEYHIIKNKADFIRTLGDHYDEIRSFIKTNRLRFSQDKTGNMVRILEYYDSLH
jgi:hypothetical protein